MIKATEAKALTEGDGYTNFLANIETQITQVASQGRDYFELHKSYAPFDMEKFSKDLKENGYELGSNIENPDVWVISWSK